jgi:hypothetical protein
MRLRRVQGRKGPRILELLNQPKKIYFHSAESISKQFLMTFFFPQQSICN